jgi:N-acylneuraminate cytidylyltransferase/CMP-N,N'-diacetyllegionaminic acid synthase
MNLSGKKLLKYPVAVISARGGSTRLKNKNILTVFGKPLIYWSICAAKKSKYIKDVFVSSDSIKILNICKQYNVKLIKRKKKLAKDSVPKINVVRNAIKIIEKTKKPTLIISLQANSPEIRNIHIDRAIDHLIKYNRHEVISVDKNNNQDAAIRILKYKALFSNSLSSYVGFVKTNLIDVHFKKDLNKIKMNVQ